MTSQGENRTGNRFLAAVAAGLIAPAIWLHCAPTAQAQAQPAAEAQGAIVTGNPAPGPEQIRALIARAIENQHRDDVALQEYERIEHKVTRNGENADVVTDISERFVPSASGNIKLKVAEKGVPVTPELYRTELQFAVGALNQAIHPTDRYKEDVAKFQRRQRDHFDLVDTTKNAFRVTWAGRETRADSAAPHGTRTFMKFLLDPNPAYVPINRFAVIFQHIHATLWVDEEQLQFARLEGDIASDIPFIGGIGGKVYRGGHVALVQEQVEPGVWLPTLYTYDLEGRKFLFPFGIHERTDIARYRRIGPPPQAIEFVRNDLNNPATVTPAPITRTN